MYRFKTMTANRLATTKNHTKQNKIMRNFEKAQCLQKRPLIILQLKAIFVIKCILRTIKQNKENP